MPVISESLDQVRALADEAAAGAVPGATASEDALGGPFADASGPPRGSGGYPSLSGTFSRAGVKFNFKVIRRYPVRFLARVLSLTL